MKWFLVFVFFLLLHVEGFSQDKKTFTLSGYATTMQSVMFDSLPGPFVNENLLHNRLNFKGYINKNITFSAEFRNRLFTGDRVKLGKDYTDLIGADDGLVDLSWNVAEKQSFLFNTTLDRLWIDFHSDDFQVTAGRQRINWGQTFVWNPNDFFNAYSFFDFDHIEKPGSDAVRLQYFPSPSSTVEFAVKANNGHNVTAAGLYRFNKWGYDLQVLAGIVNSEDMVVGTGWSGAIGSTSFRGEVSWFEPYKGFPGGKRTLLITSGLDKVLKDNSIAQLQLMYCDNPLRMDGFNSFYSRSLSSKDLAFSRFSAFGQYTLEVAPLLNAAISAMWFPDLKGYFAGPSIDFSLAENIDLLLLWQHFYSNMGDTRTRINMGFLRLKYSF